jgi:hypothetical protein
LHMHPQPTAADDDELLDSWRMGSGHMF